jgi:hypothetical protein
MAKNSSSKSSIKTPMAKREKSKHGALKRTTSLSNCIKNTLKSGPVSPHLWEIVTKTSVFIVIEGFPNSESIEKYGLLKRIKPFER